MNKRLAVTGSRHWPGEQWWRVWDELHDADYLILGDCPTGVDLWARRFVMFYRRSHVVHLANWETEGYAAGPNRNGRMAADGPTHGVALVVPTAKNNGTRDCYRKLRDVGIICKVVRSSR
jgi:hypothetical protein